MSKKENTKSRTANSSDNSNKNPSSSSKSYVPKKEAFNPIKPRIEAGLSKKSNKPEPETDVQNLRIIKMATDDERDFMVEDLEDRLEFITRKYRLLEEEKARIREERVQLTESIQNLMERNKTLTSENGELTEQLLEATNVIADLRRQTKLAQQNLRTVAEENETLKRTSLTLKKENETLKEKRGDNNLIDQYSQEIAMLRKEKEEDVTKLREANARHNQTLMKTTDQINNLQDEVNKYKAKVVELSQQLQK